MNPDQTAPLEQSDLGPYHLQYNLSKTILSRQEKQSTEIMNRRLKVRFQLYLQTCFQVLRQQKDWIPHCDKQYG